MAKKKKKFGWDDVAELASHAATMVGHYQNAQKAANKAFNEGNKSNLEGAEGGKSIKPKLPKDTGISSLNTLHK